jgi:hypothetical protein
MAEPARAEVAPERDPIPEARPGPLELECFPVDQYPCDVIPGRPDRAWMDESSGRHAYRCLPLTIANSSGWEILCPADFSVTWNGGPNIADLDARMEDPTQRYIHFAKSHFASGIVTLHAGWLFRTPPGWGLWAMGAPNLPKDGIAPLAGLIETDWLPYPFTMNWKMTRPGTVRFEKGEPFCFLVPMPHGRLEDFTPVKKSFADDPVLEAQHKAMRDSREAFGKRLAAGEPEATRKPWERHYFLGRVPGHPEVCPVHTNKRRLQGFAPEPVKIEPVKPAEAPKPAAIEPEIMGKGFPADAEPQAVRLLGIDLATGKITNLAELAKLLGPMESIARVVHEPVPAARPEPKPVLATPPIIGHDPGADPYADYMTIDRRIAGYPVFCEPDFLDPAEARFLCETFERNRHLTAKGASGADSIWNDRFIFIQSLPDEERRAKRMMQDARARILQRVDAHFQPDRPLYSDTIQIVRWLQGMEMEVHADNCDHHTGQPNGVPHREYAAVVYLNDDYEGGDLVIPPLKARVRPKAGLLVCFKASADHAHGVTRITRGTRYTMPGWYSHDVTKRDASVREIY